MVFGARINFINIRFLIRPSMREVDDGGEEKWGKRRETIGK